MAKHKQNKRMRSSDSSIVLKGEGNVGRSELCVIPYDGGYRIIFSEHINANGIDPDKPITGFCVDPPGGEISFFVIKLNNGKPTSIDVHQK